MEHQDWTPIVIRRQDMKNKKMTLNEAQQKGLAIETIKKVQGGKNNTNKYVPTQKIEDEDGPTKIKFVSTNIGQKIAQARAAKSLSRKDLANRLNVKESVIADHENGKAVYNGQFLQRMAQILGVSLKN